MSQEKQFPALSKEEHAWYRKAFCIEIVQKLRETASKNEKEAIIFYAAQYTKWFKEYLKLVYSSTIRFNIKKIPAYKKPKDFGDIHMGTVIANKMLDPLILRQKRGGEAEKHLEFILSSLNGYDSEALELMIDRDLQAGVNVGLINNAVPGLIAEYPVMLCEGWDEDLARKLSLPGFSQIKMDGARANLIVRERDVATKSRDGKDFGLDEEFAFLGQKEQGRYVLDGEFLVSDLAGGYLSRKEGNGILGKCQKGTATDAEKAAVVFVAWDVIALENFEAATPYSVPYKVRFEFVQQLVKRLNSPKIRVVESQTVFSLSQAQEHFRDARQRGLEGTILKSAEAGWKDGRSKEQIKLKAIEECELRIVDFKEGEKKAAGSLGALLGRSRDDKLETWVGSGFSDRDRETLWDILMNNPDDVLGKIMTVRYNEKIKDKKGGKWSLFLPRFVEIRNDKETANSLEEIK